MRVDLNTYYEEDAGGGGGVADPATVTDPAPVTDPATPAGDPFDDPAADKFDRAYVERLRRESAEHRVKAQKFGQSFDGFQDDEVEALLDLVQEIKADPKTAARRMSDLVERINEAFPDEPKAEPVTQKDVEALLNERERERAADAAVREIEDRAGTLGYTKGTPQYVDLLWRAQNQTNYDLEAAHKAIQADRQAVIDEYIKSKQESGGVQVVSGGGDAPVDPPKAGGFDSARARLEARLSAVAGT